MTSQRNRAVYFTARCDEERTDEKIGEVNQGEVKC